MTQTVWHVQFSAAKTPRQFPKVKLLPNGVLVASAPTGDGSRVEAYYAPGTWATAERVAVSESDSVSQPESDTDTH